jgi:hypothetical protein
MSHAVVIAIQPVEERDARADDRHQQRRERDERQLETLKSGNESASSTGVD